VDGDGRADAIVVNDASTVVRRSDGTKFLSNEVWGTGLLARCNHIAGVPHPNIYFVDEKERIDLPPSGPMALQDVADGKPITRPPREDQLRKLTS
jgi:hypothetical protein